MTDSPPRCPSCKSENTTGLYTRHTELIALTCSNCGQRTPAWLVDLGQMRELDPPDDDMGSWSFEGGDDGERPQMFIHGWDNSMTGPDGHTFWSNSSGEFGVD